MNRLPIVLVPVVLAAGLIAVLLASRAQRPEAPPEVTAASRRAANSAGEAQAESARLRKELEAMRADLEKQEARAAKLEADLARARSAEGTTTDAPESKAAARKGDWKTRHDAEFEAKVKAMPWRKHVKSLVEYWKEVEKSRAEGRAPRLTPDMIEGLTKLQGDSVELAKTLGLEGDPYKAFQNDVVSRAWHDNFLQELSGGSLTEEQIARLRETKIYANDPEPDFANGSLFEAWKHLVDANKAYVTDTQGILTADQYALVSKSVTPTFMMSVYAVYSEKTIAASGADAAKAVALFWQESFKLPAENLAGLETIAAELVRQQGALAQAHSAQYGASPPREAEFELLIKSIDLQMAAEKKLVESLALDAEASKKFLKGSGAVLKITGGW